MSFMPVLRALGDLVVPIECAGCGTPLVRWCPLCDDSVAWEPTRCVTRFDAGVPVWSVTPYRGAIRRALVQWKEHGRTDLQPVLVHRLAYALASLLADGELSGIRGDPTSVILIPAPSRWLAHRQRGTHPVRDLVWGMCEVLGDRRVDVAEVLRLRLGSRDAVGLNATERVHNVRGKVVLRRNVETVLRATWERSPHVILIDDIVTTGALLRESATVLSRHGITVSGAVVFAAS